MNALLRFRLDALDRRLPLLAALVGGALAAVPTLPPVPAFVFLAILPLGAGWLASTAVSHARSKEDHLQRIAAVESEVNEILGVRVLTFQSMHPSRGRVAAGRSGLTAVLAVSGGALAVVCACAGFFLLIPPAPTPTFAYLSYLLVIAVWIVLPLIGLTRYRGTDPPDSKR